MTAYAVTLAVRLDEAWKTLEDIEARNSRGQINPAQVQTAIREAMRYLRPVREAMCGEKVA